VLVTGVGRGVVSIVGHPGRRLRPKATGRAEWIYQAARCVGTAAGRILLLVDVLYSVRDARAVVSENSSRGIDEVYHLARTWVERLPFYREQ